MVALASGYYLRVFHNTIQIIYEPLAIFWQNSLISDNLHFELTRAEVAAERAVFLHVNHRSTHSVTVTISCPLRTSRISVFTGRWVSGSGNHHILLTYFDGFEFASTVTVTLAIVSLESSNWTMSWLTTVRCKQGMQF